MKKAVRYYVLLAFAFLFGCAGAPFTGTTSSVKEVIRQPKIGNEYSFALDRIRGYVGFADGNSKHINSIGRFEVVNESVLPMTVLFVSNSRHSSEWGVPTTVAPMSRRLLFEGRPRDINAYLGEPGGHAMKYPVKGRLIFTFLEGPLPKEVKILDMIQGDVL